MERTQTFFRVQNNLEEIPRVHEIFSDFAGRCGLPEEVRFAFDLALEEILTNVILHGFTGEAPHEIEVRLCVEGTQVTAEVEDNGLAFNPLEHPDPDTTRSLQERAVGGLGILLVRRLMEALEYRRHGNRNLLVMSKRWSR